MSFEQGNLLLSFNCLFNGVVAANALVWPKTNNQTYLDMFNATFFGLDPYVLATYMRYIVLELFMGGAFQVRDMNSLLFGYEDPLLDIIKHLDPLQGGDPSVATTVALAGVNMTREDALQTPMSMNTGSADVSQVRMYESVLGVDYIATPVAAFNGNETYTYLSNPWLNKITLYGTDSDINKPGLDINYQPPVLITDILFQVNLSYSGENITYNGINALRFRMAEETMQKCPINEFNCNYYANQWDGLINVSSIQKAPLFFSQRYLYGSDAQLQDAITIYLDENQTEIANATLSDDTFVDIEPYTGVNIGTAVRLQLNYEFQADDLFSTSTYAMLPIFVLERGTAFSDSQVDSVFGQLRTGLAVVADGPLVCYIMSAVMLLVTLFCLYRLRKMRRNAEQFENDSIDREGEDMRQGLRNRLDVEYQ